jgi:Zn-dependent peptidase ImmA (M78 family)
MASRIGYNIEGKAEEILQRTSALWVPVPVDRVALGLNLRVEPAELGDDVSGVLVIEHGIGTIGYNATHPHVRQRFSVAHEIGHFVLHGTQRQLFIDKRYTAVYRRDRRSSTGDHRREVEANRFAAALLMPESLVLREIQDLDFDLADEQALAAFAARFQVSTHAMSLRLGHLRIFSEESQPG